MGTASETYRATLESDVSRYLSSKTVTGSIPTHVISQVWKTENPKRVYLHLINHDVENKITDLPLSLEIPPNFNVEKVFLASPDLSGDQILSHVQNGGRVSFTIPELDSWDLIVITSTQESQESGQKASLINSLACGPSPASSSTAFYYNLTGASTLTISIYTITGELIKVMTGSCDMPNFDKIIAWDLKDASGTTVQNGVYIYLFEARGQSGRISRQRGKLIVFK
jgi:hypothetical protein